MQRKDFTIFYMRVAIYADAKALSATKDEVRLT